MQKVFGSFGLILVPTALLALTSACTSAPTRAPAAAVEVSDNQVTCGQSQAHRHNFRYCITKPARGTSSRDLLYFLHGNGGNELSWDTPDHHALERAWKATDHQPPVIVTISFGSSWFLSQEEGLFSQSLFDAFTEAVIPDIEKRVGFKPEHRLLIGESMGGFNAALLYFKSPKTFSRAAILCPAILPFNPHAPAAEIKAYLDRNQPHVRADLVEKWRAKLAKAFSTADIWLDHHPLALAGQATSASPPLFLMSDEADAFGFHEASETLHSILKERSVRLTWQSIPGGAHCQQSEGSIEALGRFLGADHEIRN